MTRTSGFYDNDMEEPTDCEKFCAINIKRRKDKSEIVMRKGLQEHQWTEDTQSKKLMW